MSGHMAPGPQVAGGRLGLCLRLGLVMAIGLIWVTGPTRGMAGTGRRGKPVHCPICGEAGGDRGDGFYACKNGHVFTKKEAEAAKEQAEAAAKQAESPVEQADGTYACINGHVFMKEEAEAAQSDAAKVGAAQTEATSAEAAKREG